MNKKETPSIQFPYQIVVPLLLGCYIFRKYLWEAKWSFKTWKNFYDIWSSKSINLTVMGVMLSLIVVVFLLFYYRLRAKSDVKFLRIIPSNKVSTTAKIAEEFVADLYERYRTKWMRIKRGREWFGLLTYVNRYNEIEIYFSYPEDKQTSVIRVLQEYFPACALEEIAKEELPLPKNQNMSGGHFFMNQIGKQAGLPLQSIQESKLGSIYRHMDPYTWIWVRFSPNQSSKRLEKRAAKGLENLGFTKEELKGLVFSEIEYPEKRVMDLKPEEKARYRSLFQQHTGREKSFQVAVCVWSQSSARDRVVQDVKGSIKRVLEWDNYVELRKRRWLSHWMNPLCTYQSIPWWRQGMTWSHKELGNLLHVPDGKDPIYNLPEEDEERPYIATHGVPGHELNEGMLVGRLDQGSEREIRIPYRQWTYMGFGSGETGSGKTALFLNMMYSHLEEEWYRNPSAPGFTFVDPKGDAGLKLLAKINSDFKRLEQEGIDITSLKERIHYFDLASTKYILGLNLLHKHEGIDKESIVNQAMDLLKNAYQDDSMLLDKFGQMALHALLADHKTHSILGMEQILKKDSSFRDQVLPYLAGSIYEADWAENKKAIDQGKVTQPIVNRMQKIRLNARMRRLFGQADLGLHPAKWMDRGDICIFNVSGLGKEERRMAVGFIITQYHVQAQQRKRKNKIHLHMEDEYHLVQIPIVKNIYAIDRYTGHCFLPMTQYVDQLEPDILDAFDGNASTLIACNQGNKSARAMAEISGDHIDPYEIQNLPSLTAVVSTKNSKGERITFRIKSKPPYLYHESGKPTYFGTDQARQDREEEEAFQVAQRFGEELMKRDCTPVKEVDQWIQQYLSK
ncbi:hypothetical protein SAMN05444392_11655 [Seinonella peptonophila]|uniref:Uncharacterized protein n=1 Tax=Seinonella peptonophila TaxID=112248 RepID=A0A1M5AX70_9BACL|nr:hypothetical protein [Seinonella peptonophila]SHF34848.1 hypothetical protein SAMN05444392_11655 [Seinonella peptonophila]